MDLFHEACVCLLCFVVGHAFAEKRKKIALREYKKLLKKTREEHRERQSSQNKDQLLVTRPQRVSDTATTSEQVCIHRLSTCKACYERNEGVK